MVQIDIGKGMAMDQPISLSKLCALESVLRHGIATLELQDVVTLDEYRDWCEKRNQTLADIRLLLASDLDL